MIFKKQELIFVKNMQKKNNNKINEIVKIFNSNN